MERKSLPILYIIIPCYNEETVLPITVCLFLDKLQQLEGKGKIHPCSQLLFVDDGSRDSTWLLIQDLAKSHQHISGLRLSRNRGHQNALLAGLMEAREKCDITISMDCDGQDDIDAIDAMLEAYFEGSEIVYGVRSNRESDSFLKRTTAESFYRLLNWMGAEVVFNHADYRLVSARVLKEFEDFREVNIYLRGMFPLVGFQSTCVYYARKERIAGQSHYPLGKMLALAFDGITSLSIKPIRMITCLGLLISLVSFGLIVYALVSYFSGNVVIGWASTLSAICFLGGIQMIALGVIGEYVGKIYLESKNRPRYIISERTEE